MSLDYTFNLARMGSKDRTKLEAQTASKYSMFPSMLVFIKRLIKDLSSPRLKA